MATKKDNNSPATTSTAYDIMCPRWEMVDALLGGTEAMRKAREKYLPKHAQEEQDGYQSRLDSSFLLNMTELTLNSLAGKPFANPITIGEDTPDKIRDLLPDIDLQGNSMDVFAYNLFRGGVAKGFNHILVDFPKLSPKLDGTIRTKADDDQENRRPYWVQVAPENIIAANHKVVNGRVVLTHVRIREDTLEPDGFGERLVKRIKVWTPGHVQLWELSKQKKNGKETWEVVDEYDVGIPVIPLATFYTEGAKLFHARPMIMNLAWLNVDHWQSYSDQRNVLGVARFPMLGGSGVDDAEGIMKVGPRQRFFTNNPQGKFYYIEHTGASIASGREHLQDLEGQMAGYGAQFLKKRPSVMPATSRVLDSAESLSPLQTMVTLCNDTINQALEFTAMWLRMEEGKGGSVLMDNDFGLGEPELEDVKQLAEARQRGDISRSWFLFELKRRGILADNYDETADNEKILAEKQEEVGRVPTIDLNPNGDQ